MHLFGHTFDHDQCLTGIHIVREAISQQLAANSHYFELPRKGERDAQSITRCFTSHHRDFRAVPRANRTFSTARNPIPCASSSKGEPPVCAPGPPWRFCDRAASSGGHTYCAIPEGCVPLLAPLPPAGNVRESSLVS